MRNIVISFILSFFLSSYALGRVEICHRKAQIAFGLVNHYWLQTDRVSAGMGSATLEGGVEIGDQLELPFIKVFVVDHSNQTPQECVVSENHIEECIDEELTLGKYLGRFTPLNNCQTYVDEVLSRCEKPAYSAYKRKLRRYKTLLRRDKKWGSSKARRIEIKSLEEELEITE